MSEYESVIDEVAEAFRVAHEVHGGDAGAVLHAKVVAGGAMAALLADKMAHETSVRMVVTPDIDDDTIAAIARDTDLWEHKVRDVLGAVLLAQVRGGCANAHDDDLVDLAPQLGRALLDFVARCVATDTWEPVEAMIAAAVADPRVVADAGPALANLSEVLAPMAPRLLRRTAGKTQP